MNKKTFKELFVKNIEAAISTAESVFSKKILRDIDIELHGGGVSGKITSIDDAVETMFIGESSFYRIIDIGVKDTGNNEFRIFVRISSHPPSTFDKTWNSPAGNGPFKVLEPL